MHVFCAITLAVVFGSMASVSAYAYEDNNRDKDGNIVRGAYETNRFIDNTWIGIAGGINVFENSFTSVGGVNPALDINLGKWITPSVGLRIGYQGLSASTWSDSRYAYFKEIGKDGRFRNAFNHAYIHGDVLWNISNAFSGYKESRTWNFVPFISAGFARSFKNGAANNEFAMGAGLLNNIRISNRIDLTLEVRQLFVRQGYDSTPMGGVAGMTSATFGITFKLGKTGFRRSSSAMYENRIKDLEKANGELLAAKEDAETAAAGLSEENAILKDAVRDLENRPEPEQSAENLVSAAPASTTVFFEINETGLTEQERFHLDSFMEMILAADPEKVFHLTGYADTETGTPRRNEELKNARVRNISDLLQNTYGIPEDRIIVNISSDSRSETAALNRCVVIE